MMNMTDLIQWITVVSDFGFPICLSLFLLVRMDKKLENILQIITDKGQLNRKEKN
ncbi:YvrJ family protein [Niallia sp. 03133]|uniref:YvrJ family protein n=1 Tax=Niallia sp. 03133 TaxID=3458060 RepID=UPI0040447032